MCEQRKCLEALVYAADAFSKWAGSCEYEAFRENKLLVSATERLLMIARAALEDLGRDNPETAARILERPRLMTIGEEVIYRYWTVVPAAVFEAARSDLQQAGKAADDLLAELDKAE